MNPRELFLEWSALPASLADNLIGWDVHPFRIDGKIVAVAMVNGVEIHFACDPDVRGSLITRSRLTSFLEPLMAKRGYLTTSVAAGGATDFIRRLGFGETWSEPGIDHYMLCDVPFARAA